MTTEEYIDDAIFVTDYLRERFKHEQIFLMGHSFGTYIGINLAEQYPEKFHAYISMSQVTNQKQSEILGWEEMKELSLQQGEKKLFQELDQFDMLASQEQLNQYLKSPVRDKAMHQLGVGSLRTMNSVISGIFFPSFRLRHFSRQERINIWLGKIKYSDIPVIRDAFSFNSFQEVPELTIPIYFIAGQFDLTCNYQLQNDYFQYISAPIKEFYTFHESAHSPVFEEKDKAFDILTQIKNTY